MDFSPRYGRFRVLLRKIREEAGFNQEQLAKKLGKAQTYVSKSELGERRIDFLETVDICAACNVPVGEFLKRLEKTPAVTRKAKRRSPRRMDAEGRLSN